MKKILLLSFFFIGAYQIGLAQDKTCDCSRDLEFLNEQIVKTPAYKRNKGVYQAALQIAEQKATTQSTYYECFEILNRLTLALNDWHVGIFQQALDSLDEQVVIYPKYEGDLEQLRAFLEDKPFAATEGIYRVKDKVELGIVYDSIEAVYKGVLLKSSSPNWTPGDIVYRYLPLEHGFLKALAGQYPGQRLITYYERIQRGTILRTGFQKDTSLALHMKAPHREDTYLREEISEAITYLKVGSFTGQYPTLRDAEAFYKSLEGNLQKKHLILDLRGNGGGGDRNSDILLKQLKEYVKDNNIYVITNISTGSNAEQFTIKLKKFKNVSTFGDRTKGSLAYEIRPKDYHTLPSSQFIVILTSKTHSQYLPYETLGVTPDYPLDYQEDWIAQVRAYIERKNE